MCCYLWLGSSASCYRQHGWSDGIGAGQVGLASKHFELWDTETDSLVGTYDTEAEALAIVRSSIRTYGLVSVEHLALGYEDKRGRTTLVAFGQELADRAECLNAQGEPARVTVPTT
jgi:hypothetical protein